jgi:hypothetical protein
MRGQETTLRAAVVVGILLSTLSGSKAQENVDPVPLTARLNWVEFQVVRGRVVMRSPRVTGSKRQSACDPESGTRESLSLTVGPPDASLRYECVCPSRQLVFELDAEGQLQVRQLPLGESTIPAVEFHQPASGKIHLSIQETKGPVRHLTADTLWHLLLAHPQECRDHLLPILERVRPDWRLLEQSHQIEEGLFRLARGQQLPDRSQWQQWVDELASADFGTRRAADRHLREAGQAVLPFLESLADTKLDAEQRLRIRTICLGLAPRSGDEPQRVTIWLSNDPNVWVTLLDDADPARRTDAARRLALLRGRAIAFDPDATPELRTRQIRELFGELAGN